jgi:hypothetical protein
MAERQDYIVVLVSDGGRDDSVLCRAWQVPPEYFSRVEGELADVGAPLPEWIWDRETGRSVLIHPDSPQDGST